MKKLIILISTLICLFLIYLIVVLLPRDYEVLYELNGYKVKEVYNKDLGFYKFFIEKEGKVFPLISTAKYTSKRKHITKIETIAEDPYLCVSIVINKKIEPICYQNEELIDFRLTSDEVKENYKSLIKEYIAEASATFESVKIYNLMENAYLVWNYKGYYYLSEEQKTTINIIKKDEYNNLLAYKINNYLITPNYDSEYFFKEYQVLNIKNLELSVLPTEAEIAYSSYYPGSMKDDVYLVDKKNKREYKINVKKNQVKEIGSEHKHGTWYNNGWETISLNKLVNNEISFVQNQIHNYKLINKKLYYVIDDYLISISSGNVKSIVEQNNEEIYYLIDATLFMYSKTTGEVKLIENSEWNFNFQNKIFIFD